MRGVARGNRDGGMAAMAEASPHEFENMPLRKGTGRKVKAADDESHVEQNGDEHKRLHGLTFDELRKMRKKVTDVTEVQRIRHWGGGEEKKESIVWRTGPGGAARKAESARTKRNRPLELPSSCAADPPSTLRLRPGRGRAHDPRFSEQAGNLNIDLFAKSFQFLNTMREEEKVQLRRRATRNNASRGEDDTKEAAAQEDVVSSEEEEEREQQQLHARRELRRMESQDFHRRRLTKEKALKRSLQQQEKSAIVATGKSDFFVTNGKIRGMLREERTEPTTEKNHRKMAAKAAKRNNKLRFQDQKWAPSKRRRVD